MRQVNISLVSDQVKSTESRISESENSNSIKAMTYSSSSMRRKILRSYNNALSAENIGDTVSV